MNEEFTKLDIIILFLLILSFGAYLGSLYSDENWKHDLRIFASNNTIFRFDYSGHYYRIQEHNLKNHYDINISNITFYTNKTLD